jgi:serine/threonine protein kinase
MRQMAHVLQVLDFIRNDQYIAIVTEFAEGGDLEDYIAAIADGRGLAVAEARDVGLAILAGLQELHTVEIVHRDLKPRNVLKFGGEWKIADFGISKNLSRMITQKTFQQYGTMGYAALGQYGLPVRLCG